VWTPARANTDSPAGVSDFGLSSLGACELFRPAVVLSDAAFTHELCALLEAVGTRVVVATLS
jgi:hypothetical protein